MPDNPTTIPLSEPIALIGAGRMGGAMLKAWLRGGVDPNRSSWSIRARHQRQSICATLTASVSRSGPRR